MQFPNLEEEDGDFSLGSAGRSRLSSLFQGESSGGDINQALTYTAPKQPKKNEGAQNSSDALKLIHVAVVHAYKLENGSYASHGKLGCAVLGSNETSNYKLLLYKGKQVHVTSCNIVPSFTLHVQKDNYLNFYDDKRVNWSLLCDSEEGCIELVKQISVAKANSYGNNLSVLVAQDLMQGEGPGLGNGDSAEIKYTGWILTNFTFGQMFDSNLKSETSFRLRLGKSKVIKGWTEGLQGAKKSSKLLLIIPPALAYGSEGMGKLVPPNSTLIFEMHVKKVKISQDSSHSPSPVKIISDVGQDRKPEVPPRTQSVSNEDTVRMRGASISEQLSQSPKKDKAQLISRMAKMGTATLPLQGAVPAQPSSESDNEDEDHQEVRTTSPMAAEVHRSRESSPKPVLRSRQNSSASTTSHQPQFKQEAPSSIPLHMTQHSSQVSLYEQAQMQNAQSYMPSVVQYCPPTIGGQFAISQQQQYSMHAIPGMAQPIVSSIADTHLPLLITESRTQNSEVRLGLSKITDKVDVVIQKVDDLRLHQANVSTPATLPSMEAAILSQNIERIVQENARLKSDSESKNSKIQSLNEKICDLLQRNQGFFEESNCMLEQRSDSLQASTAQTHARLLTLEQDKIRLSSDLADALLKFSNLEAQHSKQQGKESYLQEKLICSVKEVKERESLFSEIKEEREKNQTLVKSLEVELKNCKEDKELLSSKLQSLEEKYCYLQRSKELLEENLSESQQKLLGMANDAASEAEKLKIIHEKDIELWKSKLKQNADLKSVDIESEKLKEVEELKLKIESVQKERDDLATRVKELENKLDLTVKSESSSKGKLLALQSEMENALGWKKKHEVFYEKTRALKEKYEIQITELVNEVKQLQAQNLSLPLHSLDFAAEIKKVMNVLYKMLQAKIDPSSSYDGSKVLETCLMTIRALTFQMLEMKRQEPTSSGSEDCHSENNIPQLTSTKVFKDHSSSMKSDEQKLEDNPKAQEVTAKSEAEIFQKAEIVSQEISETVAEIPIPVECPAIVKDVWTCQSNNDPNPLHKISYNSAIRTFVINSVLLLFSLNHEIGFLIMIPLHAMVLKTPPFLLKKIHLRLNFNNRTGFPLMYGSRNPHPSSMMMMMMKIVMNG